MNNFEKSVFGQERALKTLKKFYETGRVPQALLFYGDEGIGKFRSAVEFAKLINFDSDKTGQISKNISSLTEPFIKFVHPLPRGKNETSGDSPTAKIPEKEMIAIQEEIKKKSANHYYTIKIDKANNIKISSIRDIKKFVSMDYSDIRYRVIIIQDAHLMNDEAQNALLKSLEEPPEGIVFILVTSKHQQLLTTIHSRCWLVRFDPLTNNDLVKILTNYFETDVDTANRVAFFSDGSVNKSLDLIENDFEVLLEKTILILRYSMAGYFDTAYSAFLDVLDTRNNDNFKYIISFILKWLIDAEKFKYNIGSYFFENHLSTIERFNAKYSDIKVNEVFNNINQLYLRIDYKVNLNILAMNVIFQLHTLVNGK